MTHCDRKKVYTSDTIIMKPLDYTYKKAMDI